MSHRIEVAARAMAIHTELVTGMLLSELELEQAQADLQSCRQLVDRARSAMSVVVEGGRPIGAVSLLEDLENEAALLRPAPSSRGGAS